MQLGSVLDSLSWTAALAGLATGEKMAVKTPSEMEPFVDQVSRSAQFVVAIPATIDMLPDPRSQTLQIRGYTRSLIASIDHAYDLIEAGMLQVTDAQRARLDSARDDLEEMFETFNLTLDHFSTVQSAITAER